MSLVDYASSSDDDVSEDREEKVVSEAETAPAEKPQNEPQLPNSFPTIPPNNQRPSESISSPNPSPSCIEKLPDASLLLNSPSVSFSIGTGTDHASRVAVAMAESESRKRAHGLPSTLPRSKVPKGSLPHTKMHPDTVGGILVPPQLSGRSVQFSF
ncbi:uncharacterized protein LOC110613932 isoform X2 [Manihot esculenta]|uniref:uncharacterized protein LOC110613932 isoform X2 n=1 Tax=Manihot esculenta TaxID=3983 RepID=UPI000B5D3F00|nr:uncharacterized protein LOC110613932 isoform X2 [Manihot esculenta]